MNNQTPGMECAHWINGKTFSKKEGPATLIDNPYTGQKIGHLYEASNETLNTAIKAAKGAQSEWKNIPLKERSQVLYRFRQELLKNKNQIAEAVANESGKLPSEGLAGLMKGIEVLEFALSLQNMDSGGNTEVSRGVFCETRREPLGVVAGITPFNFPAMVPMWMIPIALAVGNAFIWKPSDKTPFTSLLIAEALKNAGLPDGLFQVMQGGRKVVEALCDHPEISAIGFVGSSVVAKSVYSRATQSGKRALCLGGAKNPIILMPDADPRVVIPGVVASYTGCAGQRCMAASLLIAVGNTPATDAMIKGIAEQSMKLKLGKDMGALVTPESKQKIIAAIDRAEKEGAKIICDGRKPELSAEHQGGNWLAPTILDHVKPGSQAACDELFGPVLTIVRVDTLSEAISLSQATDYGNACSVFTTSGAVADEVAKRSHAGMIGVNIGVPVPREPFSFGGTRNSRFGHGDITGIEGVAFWSELKKVTTKWSLQKDQSWMG